MKRCRVLACFAGVVFLVMSAPAQADPARIAFGPGGNLAVQLSVGNTLNENSWMWFGVPTAPTGSSYSSLQVSFDIYRYNSTDYYLQNLWWWIGGPLPGSIANLDVGNGLSPGNPTFGFQWDGGNPATPDYRTYPFFSPGASGATAVNKYANLTMTWNFLASTVSASYDGSAIFTAVPYSNFVNASDFTGFGIALSHDTANGVGGPSVAWIDNFVVTDAEIYNSHGFEGFTPGDLNGQDGWVAGGTAPVPEPGTLLLCATGLLAGKMAARRRGSRRADSAPKET